MPNFKIEKRGSTDVVVYDDDSCHPATSEESYLAMRLNKVEEELAVLKAAVGPKSIKEIQKQYSLKKEDPTSIFPINDDQYEVTAITKVRKTDTGYEIVREDGASFFFEDVPGVEPKEGDIARFYGKGFGYAVRGLIIGKSLVFYRTEAEYKEYELNQLYGTDATEWLRRWDEGKSVWSIEMGGIGPGYEQAIQITAVEFLRHMLKNELKPEFIKTTQFIKSRPILSKLGLSGAQVNSAYYLAKEFYVNGPRAVLVDSRLKTRHILTSKNFPQG